MVYKCRIPEAVGGRVYSSKVSTEVHVFLQSVLPGLVEDCTGVRNDIMPNSRIIQLTFSSVLQEYYDIVLCQLVICEPSFILSLIERYIVRRSLRLQRLYRCWNRVVTEVRRRRIDETTSWAW